jgi:hypothetical protein
MTQNKITENYYNNHEVQRRVLLEYLQVMIALEDWHGVADLAMDMREFNARHKALNSHDDL